MSLALALALGGWSAMEAWHRVRIDRWNALIAGGGARVGPADAPPQVLFAAAYAAAARGEVETALNAYRELAQTGNERLRRDAQFNGANVYLREAAAQPSGADTNAALTLVELAKQSYRELLRDEAGDWDARYNLERSLRLAPDREPALESPPPPLDSRHTPSIAPGLPLGLP